MISTLGPWSAVVPTSTRTVAFTDLTNYTASVSRADRGALRDLLKYHEALVQPVVQQYGGRIVKNLGDSYMVLFDSATDAVRAGLDLAEQTAQSTLPIRLGIATGDVEVIDGDAFGEAVNLASRIIGRTPVSEVWFSESTCLCMNQAEIPWDRAGLHSLKGIVGEVNIFRAVPRHMTWIPEPVSVAHHEGGLVLIHRGQQLPAMPPDPTVVFLDYQPGSAELTSTLADLPVLDPARLWLVAYNIAPSDRHIWQEDEGHGLIVGLPEVVEGTIKRMRSTVSHDPGSDTIIFETGFASTVEVAVAGIALPEVPMSDVVAGYTYDLLPDARWVNRSEQAEARIDVTPSGVMLIAMSSRVFVDGRPLRPRERLFLKDGVKIVAADRTHTFRVVPGGIYAGLLLAESPTRLVLQKGQKTEVGREPPPPGLMLPDRKGQQNIRWCAGPRAARAKESGFTLDRALAGRRQSAILHADGAFEVEALHDRCPTYIWRPSGPLERVFGKAEALLGDCVVTGTLVVALRPPGRER